MMNIRCISMLACAALVLWLPGCTGRSGDGTVRIGYLHNDLHHLPLFVAIEKKMFEEAGLQITLVGAFRAGPEQMSAFGAGELDIGYVGQAPATAAVINGVADVRFIAQVNLNGSAIVVSAQSSLTSLPDLNGSLIAIPGHATMQEFLLRTALEKNNLTLRAVRTIVLKPPEMIQTLSRGSIDGFIAWEPYPSQAIVGGTARSLAGSKDILDGHPCCVLVAAADFISARPQAVKAVQSVHEKSCAYIRDNNEEAVAIAMQYTGFSREAVTLALEGITFTHRFDPESAARFVEYLSDLHYIKTKPDTPQARDLFLSQ
jgi:NitT/TauT family transport system substrate-binding protein